MDKSWFRWLLQPLQRRLEGNHTLQKVLSNTSWLLADRMIRIAVNLVIGVWVARYLGPNQFGLYNYAIGFVSLLAPLAYLGIEGIAIRELVKTPAAKNEILGSILLLRLVGGWFTAVLALLLIMVLRPQMPVLYWLVAANAVSMVLLASETIDYWFQSQNLSRITVFSRNLAFFTATVVKIALIQCQAPLLAFAWVWTLEVALMAIAQVSAYYHHQGRITDWRPRMQRAISLLRDTFPLLLSSFSIIFYMRIDQVMLGMMVDDRAVGIYAVAVRISEACYFVPSAIAASLSPAIINAYTTDPEIYRRWLQQTFHVMVGLAYAMCLVMTALAPTLVPWVFGTDYMAATPILMVHIWSLVFVFLAVAREIWVIAEGRTYISFLASGLGAVSNVLLNLYLIPRQGAMGAAIATFLSYGISGYLTFVLVPPLWQKVGAMMTRSLFLTWLLPRRG